jgi:purine-binding chemotaxis protein CheW
VKKFAVFKIGGEDFGVDIDRVVEILKAQRIYSIPELPDFLSGVITVRRIIIVRCDSEKIGILVDEIREITTLNTEEIISPPSIFRGLKRKYLTGLGKKNDRIIILLNIDDLLTSEEKIMLKESEGILNGDTGTGKAT